MMIGIRNSSFWLVFASFVLPSASMVLTIYALSFYFLDVYSERPGLIPLSELMHALPILAGFLLIGLAVDRFHRKHLATISLILRLLFAVMTIVSLQFDWLGAAFGMLFARMLFHKLFSTMEMALIQGLLQEQHYSQFASMKQIIAGLLAIGGSFVALAIYREYGIVGIMLVDCVFNIIAVFFIRRATIPLAVSLPNGVLQYRSARQSLHALWLDVRRGMQYIWRAPSSRSILFAFLWFGCINAILATMPLYTIRFTLTDQGEDYQQAVVTFSFLLGLSFVVGGLIFSAIGKALRPGLTIKIGMLVLTVLLPSLGYITNQVLFFLAVSLIGLMIVTINAAIGTWIPKAVDPAYMGRTYALLEPASVLTKSLGLAAIGWLYPGAVTLSALYLLSGFILLCGMAIIWRQIPSNDSF